MAVAIIGFYSVMTGFFVPHLSLGAELSSNYHERSRLSGYRHGFYTVGSIFSLATMQLLIGAEAEGRTAARESALELSLPACIFMAVFQSCSPWYACASGRSSRSAWAQVR